MFKTVLLAAALAAFGSNAFAEMYSGAEAEEIIMKGEIIESTFSDSYNARFIVAYRSKLYFCQMYVPGRSPDLRIMCNYLP